MKRNISAIIFCVLSFLLVSCMFTKKAEEVRTITVNGVGSVSATPDKASIQISVVTNEWIAKTATDTNATIMTRVQEAIVKAGVKSTDITTTGYSIRREETWQNGRVIPGRYQVRNSMKIVMYDITLVSTIIDTAVAYGATEVNSIMFNVTDEQSLLRQARTLAVQQAQDTASLLAGASGCKIGKALTIIEGNNFSNPQMLNYAKDSMAATPISSGTLEISANVTVTYELQ